MPPARPGLRVLAALLPLAGVVVGDASAEEHVVLTALRAERAVILDGRLDDWPEFPASRLILEPAVEAEAERTPGRIEVEASVRVVGDTAYFAFRWPDPTADTSNRSWRWAGDRYRRGRELDDQFAMRFEFDGDFDLCMISGRSYSVDAWLWSAGRSDRSGHADDMRFEMSTSFIDEAAEYDAPDGGTVYIKRYPDAGSAPFKLFRPPRTRSEERLDAFTAVAPEGSRADVKAASLWLEGYWHLELQRRLDTGHSDDVSFLSAEVVAQVAVFDHDADQYKSVSGPLRIVFPDP